MSTDERMREAVRELAELAAWGPILGPMVNDTRQAMVEALYGTLAKHPAVMQEALRAMWAALDKTASRHLLDLPSATREKLLEVIPETRQVLDDYRRRLQAEDAGPLVR